jgi:hypothetical protein
VLANRSQAQLTPWIMGCALALLAGGAVGTYPSSTTILVLTIAGGGVMAAYLALTREFGKLAVLVAVAGVLQGPVAATFQTPSALFLDDLIAVILFVSVLSRLNQVPVRLAALLLVLASATAFAIIRAPDLALALLQARQVWVAILLAAVGALLVRLDARHWRTIIRGTVAIGAVVASFAVVEVFMGPAVDPAGLQESAEFRAGRLVDGLPAHYYAYGILGEDRLVRSGSLLLNPPATGILLGTAMVCAAMLPLGRGATWLLQGVLAAGLLSTVGRAGILIALVGLGLPFLRRKLGPTMAATACTAGLVLAASLIVESGNSYRHLQGSVEGLLGGITTPLGHGFGRIGNLTVEQAQTGVGESLIGMAVYSLGWVALATLIWAGFRLGRSWWRTSRLTAPVVALGIAGLLAGLVSETSTALNASVALWIALGAALASTRRGVLD